MSSRHKLKPTYGSLMRAIKSFAAACVEQSWAGSKTPAESELTKLRYKLMKIEVERIARAAVERV